MTPAEPNGTSPTALPVVDQDHSNRHVLSFMVGVNLALNAISDAYMLIDGPDCTYMKTQFIQGNHDYLSTLTSVCGRHRVSHTALKTADQVALPREDHIRALMEKIARTEGVGGMLVTAMPAAEIIGIDYRRLCASSQAATGMRTIHIPCKSLSTDWLGGYAETLLALAKGVDLPVDLPDKQPDPTKIGIVGLLFDRNEEDNWGNVRELGRLLEALGLDLVSVWPGGGTFGDLGKIQKAGTILSFPYGRRAAATLASRVGAKLIEVDLPFGLTATERWLRQIAEQLGKQEQAEALITDELGRIVPRLEWVVPFLFAKRNFGWIGDPYLLPGFLETIELLGGTTRFAVVSNFRHHLEGVDLRPAPEHLLVETKVATLQAWLASFLDSEKIDCVVTNNTCMHMTRPRRHALVEFGFPAYTLHALYDRPYLGFAGAIAFIDTLANQQRQFESIAEDVRRLASTTATVVS